MTYGDVIIADPCSGTLLIELKITTTPEGVTTVANAPDYIGMEADISAHFENFSTDKTYLLSLADDWPGEKPRNAPKIVVGPSAILDLRLLRMQLYFQKLGKHSTERLLASKWKLTVFIVPPGGRRVRDQLFLAPKGFATMAVF